VAHDTDTRPGNVDGEVDSPPASAARAVGRGVVWLATVLAVIAVIAGVFLIGPFGLAIAVPALLVIWFVAGSASGGPAAGA
jgi:hypothetical protein